jgi:signal transduction histidine kinase
MKSRLLVALLLIALVVLAGLQYHWINQITVVERQRLERTGRDAANDFAEDFSADLRGLFVMLEQRPGGLPEPAAIASRLGAWTEIAAYPRLLRNLYFASSTQFLQFDPEQRTLESADWPPELRKFGELLARQAQGSSSGPRFAGVPPVIEGMDAFLIPLGRTDRDREREFPSYRQDGTTRSMAPAWVIAELDRSVIVGEIFPSIVSGRFAEFDGQNYRVAVASFVEGQPLPIFTSGGDWAPGDLLTPDYSTGLLSFAGSPGQRGRPGPPGGMRGQGGAVRRYGRDMRGFLGPQGPIVSTASVQNWRVLVKHHAGSIEDAANRFRERNLAISFGILVVLGIGGATMVISGQRAHRLGKLQMQFAAGVSHELRTPLAVIQSAAHNLGAGVVKDREGIEEYAAIVQKEARRLSEMVEQIVTYTETQSGRKRYDIAPIAAVDAVDQAIRNVGEAIREAGATVVSRIDPDLPPVMADAATLTRCVQNLLSNAIKYGGREGPANIRIEADCDRVSNTVRLSVTDHGTGVPEEDVADLFEPFHRGANAATNTPGNGLGLHLVLKMMESQKGSVSYEAVPSGGARFVLSLPAATPTT